MHIHILINMESYFIWKYIIILSESAVFYPCGCGLIIYIGRYDDDHNKNINQPRRNYNLPTKLLICLGNYRLCERVDYLTSRVNLMPSQAKPLSALANDIIFKSSQVKSNQVYCYTNNTNYTTPYNEYNVALHLKYIFQLHLTQLKFSIAKGAGNPVGLKGSRSVNTVLAHKTKQQNGIQWLSGYTVMSKNTSIAVIINIISMVAFFGI